MKNKKSKKTSTKAKLAYFAIPVVMVLTYTCIANLHRFWPFHPSRHTVIKVDGKTDYPSPKNNNPPTKQNATAPATDNKTSNEVPISPSLTANITQLNETNNNINFTATVQGATTAGTCVVTFSNPNDRPVTQQFTANNTNNISTCGPLAISAYEFSYLGNWQVEFHYYTGDQQATANANITIR